MSEAELQQLLQNQTQAVPNTSAIFESVLEPLLPLLSLMIAVGVGLSVVMVVYIIVNIIQKQRQHKAILRIDRNLQKLVDAQTPPAPAPAPAQDEPARL